MKVFSDQWHHHLYTLELVWKFWECQAQYRALWRDFSHCLIDMISGHLKHFARTPIHDLSVLRFVIKSHTSYQWIYLIIKLFGKFLVIYPGGFELIRCGSWADKFGPTSIIRWITFVVIKYLSYCRKSFPLSIDGNKSIFFHVFSYCLFFLLFL